MNNVRRIVSLKEMTRSLRRSTFGWRLLREAEDMTGIAININN